MYNQNIKINTKLNVAINKSTPNKPLGPQN